MSAYEMKCYLENRDWLCEHSNYEDIEAMDEMIPYDLVHELLKEIRRLTEMVMEARAEVNALSLGGEVYDFLAENVSGGIYFDHPALERYIELFEGDALIPWES
ncbi:MAG: hypothetical protein FWG53_01230 [Clostridiales bacterium]|nr:hypothetical protein [Clostridiales bacterium]